MIVNNLLIRPYFLHLTVIFTTPNRGSVCGVESAADQLAQKNELRVEA